MSQDSATPAHGQQVISAVVALYKFVDDEPHVMVARRSKVKKFLPDKFELPGGHIDFGETLEDGLRRELKEELSIEVALEKPFDAFTYMNEVKGSHSVEIIYFGTLVSDESTIQLDPDEHSEIFWVSKATLNHVRKVNGDEDGEFASLTRALELLEQRNR